MDKYHRTIELMNAVLINSIDSSLPGPVDLADELNKFIFDNFDCPPTYMELKDLSSEEKEQVLQTRYHENEQFRQDCIDAGDVVRMKDREEILARLTATPPRYSDVMFPIAIWRYLLTAHTWLDVNRLTTSPEFMQRYGFMIRYEALPKAFADKESQ